MSYIFWFQDFTVKVNDTGFSPRITTISPGGRVWFIWQGSDKQHNIQQVSFNGAPVTNGFNSGAARDSPSAFMHQFYTPGIYYYVRWVLSVPVVWQCDAY